MEITHAKFYHSLTIRQNNRGRVVDKIIGSAADNIDDAVRERMKIAAQYHPNQIVALTTHDVIR